MAPPSNWLRRRRAGDNPHRGDIDWSLTKRILAQAKIEQTDWDNAGR